MRNEPPPGCLRCFRFVGFSSKVPSSVHLPWICYWKYNLQVLTLAASFHFPLQKVLLTVTPTTVACRCPKVQFSKVFQRGITPSSLRSYCGNDNGKCSTYIFCIRFNTNVQQVGMYVFGFECPSNALLHSRMQFCNSQTLCFPGLTHLPDFTGPAHSQEEIFLNVQFSCCFCLFGALYKLDRP